MRIVHILGSVLRSHLLTGLLTAATLAASPRVHAQSPEAAELLSIDPAQSLVTYHIVHKLHRVDAVSKRVEGKVRILPTGAAQIAVRIPVDSFDSSNSNRDAHMKEVTEAARFPLIELKGVCDACATPTTIPATAERTIRGELTFHGIRKPLAVPVKLTYDATGAVHADASLSLSLDEFRIERPSLMFVKVDDALKLDVSLVLKR
jgi:polyisoprenoid-binding protein YceI